MILKRRNESVLNGFSASMARTLTIGACAPTAASARSSVVSERSLSRKRRRA